MIKKHLLVVGPFQCNCTILICEKTKEALVIDAGDEFSKIQNFCQKEGAILKYSIHTHAHLDHIGAVRPLKAWSPSTQILLHKDDEWLYQNLPMQGQLFGMEYDDPPPINYYIQDSEHLKFGEYSFSVIHTPGHSPGGVCLYFKENDLEKTPAVFSGDTLFDHSIGRTDLWGGDYHQLSKSIKERLFCLDEQTKVFPGHGPSTFIGLESKENPFMNG